MPYSIAQTVPYFLPASSNTSINLLASYGLDLNICDDSQDCDISTPWGIAKVVFDEIAQFSDDNSRLIQDYFKMIMKIGQIMIMILK